MVLNTYHWLHDHFATNSLHERTFGGRHSKAMEMVMRYLSLTPTLAALPLLAAIAGNGVAEPAPAHAVIPAEVRAVVEFWR